jgi:replication factor A1
MKEDIIKQIISMYPVISEAQILARLEKERRKTGGLISDETLLRMIAAEFGCAPLHGKADMPSLMIKDLVPGLNDAMVSGRVLAIFPTKEFDGARKGKLASLLIADRSDLLRIVLWNDKTDLVERGSIQPGQVARFCHGYTREDPSGKLELHLGEKSEVDVNPQGTKERDYPNIRRFSTKIGDVTPRHRNKRVIVAGTVQRVSPASTFSRKDSTQGKVLRFMLNDGTGELPVVVWNEKADELEKSLNVGDRIQVVNGKLKKGLGENHEINIDALSYVGPLLDVVGTENIADLEDGMEQVSVEGEVAMKPTLRNVKTAKEEVLKVAAFEIKDATGRIWVSAWRQHAEIASELKPGDRVLIENAYVQTGFGDQLEISTRNNTSITRVE